MCNNLTVHRQLQHDPTRTTTLRQRFEGEASRRFRDLAGIIREVVVDLDVLALRDSSTPTVNRDGADVGARAFDFTSTPQKVGAFMQWLRRMEDEQILEIRPGQTVSQASQRAWTNIYIQSAYQKGIAHAGQQMCKAGATVNDSWISAAFNRPIHADRVGLIYTRTYRALEGVTQAMDTQISRILAQGMAEGRNPLDMARDLTDRVQKIGRTRARVLARTEVINAHAEATLNSYAEAGVEGVEVQAEFATAGDSRVCEECASLAGKTYSIEESRGMIPVHPNCLPGDSLVLARSGVTAASKRWFDGDLVVIRTASGRGLSCTPNHPVLTPGGWVAARALDVGGHVISDGGSEWAVMGDDDSEDVPARIEHVAEAARRSGRMSAAEMPVSAPDFHGDGIDGDVAVVWADRELRPTSQSSLLQHRRQFALNIRDKLTRVTLAGKRALAKLVVRPLSTACRAMSTSYLSAARIAIHLRPLQQLGFASPATLNAGFAKQDIDAFSVEGHAAGNRLRGLACDVCGDNLIGERADNLSTGHVGIAQDAFDDFVRDAVLASEITSGGAGPVFRDEIVAVNIVPFSGHVYNLETGGGYYSAQGIITHNCRCAFLPALDDMRGVTLQ